MFARSGHYSRSCGRASGDSDLFLSRLINEEIKVSASQSRHKDTGRGIRHPAAPSEILISPSLYFPLRGHTALWLSLRSPGTFSPLRFDLGHGEALWSRQIDSKCEFTVFRRVALLPHRICFCGEGPTPASMSHWPKKKKTQVFDSVSQ